MKLNAILVGILAATALCTPVTAQIAPRGSPPPRAPIKAKGGGGPVTNALPGCGGGGDPAYNFTAPPPPERRKLGASPGGVDMRAGQLIFQNADVSIGGEGDARLALIRTFAYKSPNSMFRQALGEFFTHNWDIQINERRAPISGACYPNQFDYNETVVLADLGDGFRKSSNETSFHRTSSVGFAELSGTFVNGKPDNLVFTARDGTVVTFLPFFGSCGQAPYRCTFASSVKRPDGTVYSLSYEAATSGAVKRLHSVSSNRGYALLFEYNGGNDLPTKVCALNLADGSNSIVGACPVSARSASYSYSGTTQVVTEMSGGAWTFAKSSPSSFSLTRPGEGQPYVVNTYSFIQGGNDDEPAFVVDSQQLADGRSYTYAWNVLYNDDGQGSNSQQVMGGSWTDGQGRSFHAVFGAYYGAYYQPAGSPAPPTYSATPGPESVIDELGRVTSYDYCSAVAPQGGNCIIPPVKSVTDAEGAKELYAYTAFNNIGQITRVAKAGSGLSDLIETRNFDFNAPPPLWAKPTYIVDARNATTVYTYDTTHGGVLTETLPADANGVQRSSGMLTASIMPGSAMDPATFMRRHRYGCAIPRGRVVQQRLRAMPVSAVPPTRL